MGGRLPDVLEDVSDEVRDDEWSLRVVRLLAGGLVGFWAVALTAVALDDRVMTSSSTG